MGQFKKLVGYLGVKAEVFNIRVDLHKEYCIKVTQKDYSTFDEVTQLCKEKDALKEAFHRIELDSNDSEFETYMASLNQIRTEQVPGLLKTFGAYENAHNAKSRVYHHYLAEQESESLDQFRSDILQHLAGSIIVKEHRQRYQKEQYDRFVGSLLNRNLKKVNVTLNEFCVNYALMIEQQIVESHNGLSPNI